MTCDAEKNKIVQPKSVKKNYFFNLCSQVFSVIFPLIITPYISRVLSPEGVGQYAYAYSIIQYFVLFATFGFNLYGQREIAKHQGDKEAQSKILVEIIAVRAILVAVALAAELIVTAIGGFSGYSTLMFVMWIFIMTVAFDISFFFQGNEEFGIIAFLNIFVRIISLAAIFLFVKDISHVWVYALIMALNGFFSQALSWLFLPKRFKKFVGKINLTGHFRNSLVFFIPAVSITVYTVLNKTLIKAFTGSNEEVAFFEQAEKIVRISLTAVTTIGTVMMSRNSARFQNNDHEGVRSNIYMSCSFVLMLAIPMTFGLVALAPNMIPWFLGDGYEKSIILMMLLCAMIIPVGISNVIGVQYLIPCGKEKQYTISVIIGAVINLGLSIPLIIFYKSIGATIATIGAECGVMISQFIFARKDISLKKVLLSAIKFLIAGGVMFVILFFIQRLLAPKIYWTLALLVGGVVIYFVALFVLRDSFMLKFLKQLTDKIRSFFKKPNKEIKTVDVDCDNLDL